MAEPIWRRAISAVTSLREESNATNNGSWGNKTLSLGSHNTRTLATVQEFVCPGPVSRQDWLLANYRMVVDIPDDRRYPIGKSPNYYKEEFIWHYELVTLRRIFRRTR